MIGEHRDNLIRRWLGIDDATQRLITLCTFYLHFGPFGPMDDNGQPWPGFAASCDLIGAAIDTRDLWVNGEYDTVTDTEPDWYATWDPYGDGNMVPEYSDEDCMEWYCYSYEDIKRVLCGRELAGYV